MVSKKDAIKRLEGLVMYKEFICTINRLLSLKTAMAVLLASFITIFPASVDAQTVTSAQIKTQVANLFENNYKKITDGEVQVKIIAVPFADIQLPDGKITYKISSGSDKILPRDVKRVDVYVNGAFIRTLNLPAQTSVYKDVLVASDFIDREQSLTKDCTEVKRVDVAMRADYVLDGKMLEKEITTKKIFCIKRFRHDIHRRNSTV